MTAEVASPAAVLWPGGEAAETYAVLDGARDRRIEGLLMVWGLEQECLYGSGIEPDLRNAAPWLVRLDPAAETSAVLLRAAWGQAWGIFAVAPPGTGMGRAARHFRRLTRVLDAAGQVMLFRFHDPRVLRAFIPICDAAQRAELFGPVARYVVEGPDGAPLVFRAEA